MAIEPAADVKSFEFRQPVRVLFGPGQLQRVGDEARQIGQRVAVLTMPELVKLGYADRTVGHLHASGCETRVFDSLEVEPTATFVDSFAAEIRGFAPDVLVALGGGSVMDGAKALAIRCTHPEPTWMYVNLSNRPPLPLTAPPLPLIAIPTTSGTGAEVTPYAVLTNHETSQKGTIKNPGIFPRVAIVDPDLTLELPLPLTAATGIDAFAHALESYLNVPNRTPYSDFVAERAMLIIHDALPRLMNAPGDRALRAQVAWASTLAGVAIANAGTTVAHALAQPLGARAHVPHAVAVAIFTVPVLRHTWRADQERFAAIARLLAPSRAGDKREKLAEMAVDLIASLVADTGMERRIGEFSDDPGIGDKILEDLFSYMSRPLAQHPKHFSRDEARAIIAEAS